MFSVVILNFDGMRYLPDCLRALRAQTDPHPREIVVVNNRSSDGSREYLLSQEDVRLIDPGWNTGFSRGQNLGLLASRGEFALCLNFDCVLEPRFLEEARAAFARDPRLGAVSGKLKKLVAHRKTDLIDSTGIAFDGCAPADRGEGTPDGLEWSVPGPVFGASGAAACYRRSALEDVRFRDEFFDEDMFLYCEDVDLAWRLNLRGWGAAFVPSAVAYHERGSTRKASAWERRNYFLKGFRNRFLGLYKNLRRREDLEAHSWRLAQQEVRYVLTNSLPGPVMAATMLAALFQTAAMIAFRPLVRERRRFVQGRLAAEGFSLAIEGEGSTLVWFAKRLRSRIGGPIKRALGLP